MYFFYLYYSDMLISNKVDIVVLGSVAIPKKRKQFYSKKMASYYANFHASEVQSKNKSSRWDCISELID